MCILQLVCMLKIERDAVREGAECCVARGHITLKVSKSQRDAAKFKRSRWDEGEGGREEVYPNGTPIRTEMTVLCHNESNTFTKMADVRSFYRGL